MNSFYAIEDDRSIISLKGRIVILDKYGDSLYNYDDIDIQLEHPIQSLVKPRLSTVYKDEFRTSIYHDYTKLHYLELTGKDVPEKLKTAILQDQDIKAKFIPEIILFTDGSALK